MNRTNDRTPVNTLIALGANIGDPVGQLRDAVERLREVIQLQAISAVYITEPVGFREQPEFHNMVVAGRTDVTIFRLRALGERIEHCLGRQRSVPDAPRVIDVDLLAYGELIYSSASLTVPHPRMHRRSFVLTPLAEIAPDWRHPVFAATALELSRALAAPTGVRFGGRL